MDKDQSYVLSMLGQAELGRVTFPVGEMTKSAVRAHAVRLGLRTAGKPDSQDVCFIGSVEGRQGFLADKLQFHPAEVTNGLGETVGSVDAVELVTVGQRRGMGHGTDGARRYVIAVDPVAFKRDEALKFGATHVAASIEEATPLVNEVTWGKNADKVIMTMGVGDGSLIESVMQLTAKRGRVVVTNIHPMAETTVNLSLTWLTLFEKQLVGTVFGSANIRYDIPHLLRLYEQGQLDLDNMVTRTYTLDGVNEGYADMLEGRNIRGVMIYD